MKINKETITGIVIALLLILSICSYPLIVKVENGKTTCENLLGKTVKCR